MLQYSFLVLGKFGDKFGNNAVVDNYISDAPNITAATYGFTNSGTSFKICAATITSIVNCVLSSR